VGFGIWNLEYGVWGILASGVPERIMILRSRLPVPELRPFVESLWFFADLEVDHARECVLPDGGMQLIIDLTGTPKRLYDGPQGQSFTPFRQGWVSGMRRAPIVIGAEAGGSLIGAKFRTGGAAPFFDFPLSELNGAVVELDLIWHGALERLRESLLSEDDIERRFRLLETFLLRRARARLQPDPAVHAALACLRTWPVVRLRNLADDLGLSQKRLIARFDAQVGMTPKLVSRLLRFGRTVLAIHGTDGDADWTELALQNGYYDQAHLIHEFRDFSGITPGAYAAAKSEYPFYLYQE
jgi:AraC-like DNA-binding protein